VSTKATRFGRLSAGHLETRFNINREDEWRAVPSWLARTVCVSLGVHVFKQAFNIIHLLRVLSRGLSSVRRHSPLPLALSLFLSLSRFPRSTNLGLSTVLRCTRHMQQVLYSRCVLFRSSFTLILLLRPCVRPSERVRGPPVVQNALPPREDEVRSYKCKVA